MFIKVLGNIRSKKNSKQWTGKHLISSKAYQEWDRISILQLQSSKHLYPELDFPIDYPVSIKCLFYFKTLRYLDIDNALASIMDPLESAGIISNDKLVQSVDGSRLYLDRDNPRVEIQIEPFTD